MLSESLQNLFHWLEKKKGIDGGAIILNETEASILTGQIGGMWRDAMELEKAGVPAELTQPEVSAGNNDNVVRLDRFRTLNFKGKGDAA